VKKALRGTFPLTLTLSHKGRGKISTEHDCPYFPRALQTGALPGATAAPFAAVHDRLAARLLNSATVAPGILLGTAR
jgi:hypothetical protein